MAEALQTRIRTQVMGATKDEVARKLRSHWSNLRIIKPELPEAPPTEEELLGNPAAPVGSAERDGIAGQLIKARKASFSRNGTTYTLDLEDINQKLSAYASQSSLPDQVKGMLKSIGNVNELVPTEATVNEIADATTRGIESQTSTGNKIWSFIKAAGYWLAAAVGSLFGGKSISFSEALAQAAAPGVGSAVRQNLNDLANDPSKPAARLLRLQDANGQSTIDTIVDMAISGTYKELGAAPPPSKSPPRPALDAIKPVDFDIGAVRTYITEYIQNPPPGTDGKPRQSLRDHILSELKSARESAKQKASEPTTIRGFSLGISLDPTRFFLPSDEKLQKASDIMSKTIADTVAAKVSDPDFRTSDGRRLKDLSREEFSQIMAEEVSKALLAAEKRADSDQRLDIGIALTSKMPDRNQRYIDFIEGKVKAQMADRYDELKPALDMVKPGQTYASLDLRGNSGQSAGITGGVDVGYASLGNKPRPNPSAASIPVAQLSV